MEIIATHLGAHLVIGIAMFFASTAYGDQQGTETVAEAARKAFVKGVEELAGGNHTGAITLLKTAVRIQPNEASYHHQLSKAFLAAEKYHDMWVHLRKAAMLDFRNEEFAQDFLRMWRYHDLQGTLNVGTPDATVLKALGEPDKRIENDQMRRWVFGFMAVDFGKTQAGGNGVFRVIDLRGYTAAAAQEVEQVRVKTDSSKWQVAHHQVSRTNDNLELTSNGEKIQQWSELFSKQRFPLMSQTDATVKGMTDSIRKSLAAIDPDVEFTVISETPTEVLYHWVTSATENNPAQHEIAKIIKGQKDFYRVAYVKKTDRLSNTEFDEWSEVIGNATLVPMRNSTDASSSDRQTAIGTTTQLQSWELGKSLAFAALIRGKHGPDEIVKKALLTVSKNAQSLNVSVPAPGKLTDDVNADTAAAIEFLLATAGKPIYNSLQENHGAAQAALFELATKSTLLTMLYQPGDSTSESFATAIERAAKKANLGASIWQPLTDRIAEQAEASVVNAEIKQFQLRVAQSLSK